MAQGYNCEFSIFLVVYIYKIIYFLDAKLKKFQKIWLLAFNFV